MIQLYCRVWLEASMELNPGSEIYSVQHLLLPSRSFDELRSYNCMIRDWTKRQRQRHCSNCTLRTLCTMAFNIPTSGQWITFPINILRFVQVEWRENYTDHSAMYYVTRCFWGYLEGEKWLPDKPTPPAAGTKEAPPKTTPPKPWPPKLGTPEIRTGGEKVRVHGTRQIKMGAEFH